MDAVIVDTIRTPVGRAMKGSLRDVRADDLAAASIRALVERNPGADFTQTEDLLWGCAFGAGEQRGIARSAGLLAGLGHHVPAVTINRFCASSLQAIRDAHHAIVAGAADMFIAGGVEAVSRNVPTGEFEQNPKIDGSEDAAYDFYIPMGLTAENVAERCGVSRADQDEWAVISQARAVEARDQGVFSREIVPVSTPDGAVVSEDDGPRPGTTREVLAKLKPAFKPDGSVTAGNSCPLNDGSAAVLVMSDQRASASGLKPRARIVATSVAGVRPEMMGLGPIPAVEKLLESARMTIADVDIVELNEAFAAQVLPCMQRLGIDAEKLNPFGGAIALGHPFGMTGARMTGTLLNGLETTDGHFGIVTMCVAGGMGMAMLVERL